MFHASPIAAFAAALALATIASADVITIPAARDNTLFNDLTGSTSNGSGPILIVGRAGGMSAAPIRRALIAFDVAAYVPAGATITSVQLVLSNSGGNVGPRTIELHRINASWGEGASNTLSGQGAPAQAGDATWLHRFYPSVPWSALGGDFAATPSATLAVDPLGIETWPSTALAVADVQAWLDAPAANFGWLVKLDIETVPTTTRVFDSREAADATVRPQLVVTFAPPQAQFTYCVSQKNSLGCTPAIAGSGTPSAGTGSSESAFDIQLSGAINGKAGMLVYSTLGASAVPLYGGTLCVANPVRHAPIQSSGGSASGDDCSGSFSLDFNQYIASGADSALAVGAVVWCQWVSRDSGNVDHFNTSNALRFVIGP
jgi:hypothetical protein